MGGKMCCSKDATSKAEQSNEIEVLVDGKTNVASAIKN